ncbi:tripartite tricarboxylate transporter substrate binding protein [Roseomonas sp. HJA6]|uniref:Tripartite tricarboxylate transporter substrate binding protein n=1 Tax=Roseomonas alba TaxID=2846776 RepID=A0ABS7A4R0_9PROT|nr:tripartite tricarboxylate transporter substrate binding protein [Neoroseomonas alba]MBW6397258.1 tripartite tricarboxylate transporter substrate binding protein [Neoroseomonas alba]
MTRPIGRRAALSALAAAPALPRLAAAQGAWPDRPIRAIVAFPAGSGTDVTTRLLTEPIAADLGQPIVVDNRGGANGFIASEAVARSRPDGYTFLFTANTTHGSNPALFRRLPYDPVNDFAPVALIGVGVLLVVVNNDLPIRSMQDLVAYARANPGRLNFASGSASSRVAGEMFKSMANVDMVNVTYRSNPLGITDVIGGVAQVMFVDATTSAPHAREGRVRAIGVTSRQRVAMLPDVPTVEEQGFPGYEMLSWNAVYAPAGTPAPIVLRMNELINAAMAKPDIAARLTANGMVLRPGSPEDLANFQAAEIDKWKRLVTAAGIELQ